MNRRSERNRLPGSVIFGREGGNAARNALEAGYQILRH